MSTGTNENAVHILVGSEPTIIPPRSGQAEKSRLAVEAVEALRREVETEAQEQRRRQEEAEAQAQAREQEEREANQRRRDEADKKEREEEEVSGGGTGDQSAGGLPVARGRGRGREGRARYVDNCGESGEDGRSISGYTFGGNYATARPPATGAYSASRRG